MNGVCVPNISHLEELLQRKKAAAKLGPQHCNLHSVSNAGALQNKGKGVFCLINVLHF